MFTQYRDVVALQCLFVALAAYRTKRVAQHIVLENKTQELSKEAYFSKSKHFKKTIGIKIGIIGCGTIGKAVLEAILFYKGTPFHPHHLLVATRRPGVTQHATLGNANLSSLDTQQKKIGSLGLDKICEDNKYVARRVDILFICVQPSQLISVQQDLSEIIPENTIVVSVIAGVLPETLEKTLKHRFVLTINKSANYNDMPSMPQIKVGKMSTPENLFLIHAACPVKEGNDTTEGLAFYMKLHYILCSLYEEKLHIADRVRTVLRCLLDIDLSSAQIMQRFQDCMKLYLYQSQEFYKSKEFLEAL
jgi:hypothetical protein